MSAPPAAIEVLRDLSAGFGVLGARWYLFGAQAVVLYGRPRMTADIDVTAELPVADLDRVLEVLSARGFEARGRDPAGFLARTRVLPLVHTSTRVPVDVVLAGPGLEMEFLERVRLTPIAGVSVPVIAPEDLVVTKILAGRPKDIEDAEGIVQTQGDRLDREHISRLLHEIEQALDRSDLAPVFVALKSPRSKPRGRAKGKAPR